MTSTTLRFALVISLLLAGPEAVRADIINGDFATGDFTGWTVSAIDQSGTPISPDPFIFVDTVGANSFATFETGTFAEGLFIGTLEQSFIVEAAKPYLVWDLTTPAASPDPTGTGASPFFDSFFVSLDDGVSTYDLLLADQFGILTDPFGTAPGPVTLGAPLDPTFDFTVAADLSSMVGSTVTLYFDIIQEDDGFLFGSLGGHVETSPGASHIPEPSALGILTTLCLVAGCLRRRQQKHPQ